ncbi:MAG: DnaD domain protein [Clostridiaceae bacterium]|jgi:DnaD/phage-associated family protein|nr:DnaD domain protein [Eubacteriales bacterium]NLV47424.1 DnaD domain protein [Clostridiaceae bacterium]
MQIDESRKLLLSDTMVPDLFILEYLPTLSGIAVKIYLFLLLTVRTSRILTEQDLARRLGQEAEAVRTALLELASADLLHYNDEKIELIDIKAAEIERLYRPRTAAPPHETERAQKRFDQREKLMGDIARTFFQGMMSPSWYGEIDSWFDRYGFEPEVIYALFQECARRNKLDSKAYISKVAENWSKRGIISFNDLNQYFLDYDKVSKASRKIGKKLRKNMTEYDEEMVARWIEQLGYDFDIIELALRKTTRLSHPNLSFIDRLLQEWFEHNLHDAEAIQAYETEKAKQITQQRKSQVGHTVSQQNRGNFEQRDYSSDYLNSFFEPVTLDDDTVDRQAGDTIDLETLMKQTEQVDRQYETSNSSQVNGITGEKEPNTK